MKHKYFQITERKTLDFIQGCLKDLDDRSKDIIKLSEEFGAKDCLRYSDDSIAAFTFSYDKQPDRTIWKKVKHGFLPKVKTVQGEKIKSLPKLNDWRDAVKTYGFGNEMILGEPKPTGGIPMHSSYIRGKRDKDFFVIHVPYTGEFERDVHESLVELKEWEVMKEIEED